MCGSIDRETAQPLHQRSERTAVVIAAFLTSILGSLAAHADDLTYADLYVDEISVTRIPDAMQEPDPIPGEKSPVAATIPIGVWIKLKGNAAGLQRLQSGRFLLFHNWTEACPLTGQTFQEVPEGEKKLPVNGRKTWQLIAADLAPEVQTRGWFDWRTISTRSYIQACEYTVTVIDERGNKLPCRGREPGCAFVFLARDDSIPE